jgi:hypothetical protein
MKKTIYAFVFLSILFSGFASAELMMDSIQFDPPIIASGDTVDIIVQFHQSGLPLQDNRLGNPEHQFKVSLEPDDTMTERHIIIQDAAGDDLKGIITRGDYFNRKFRIKVNNDAPAGEYEFRLVGQWYYNNKPTNDVQYMRFSMPVKKEGVSLSVSNVLSVPEQVRSGDKNILLKTSITNTGEKAAKNVRISLMYPEGVSSSYTNNNQLTISSIGSQEEKMVQLYVDTERTLPEGNYEITYSLSYEDLDNNKYTTLGDFPFVVKKKPNLVVVKTEGAGLAGEETEIKVTLKNIGEETADSVDIRLIKQSSQPFEMDVRSDYVGELKPGEEGVAIFKILANSNAEIKEHKFTALIRAKGDSEEGDNNIYTFTDSVNLELTGKKKNNYPLYAGIFVLAVIVIVLVSSMRKKRR